MKNKSAATHDPTNSYSQWASEWRRHGRLAPRDKGGNRLPIQCLLILLAPLSSWAPPGPRVRCHVQRNYELKFSSKAWKMLMFLSSPLPRLNIPNSWLPRYIHRSSDVQCCLLQLLTNSSKLTTGWALRDEEKKSKPSFPPRRRCAGYLKI